ncbi:hypothetical protein FQ377_03265 [Arthrobacter echini]|uniref:DUF6286 domain-containing protein n=1 Tax=Arthrobacter echini TaxID=1529066 RepID=A0A5D0XUR6_9MICC|nr:DUF6286 domain-containing protein [Arthrobacter echini]TYD00474.1 hypothetical protein FQ377_03265 [Arthrobacter echini]
MSKTSRSQRLRRRSSRSVPATITALVLLALAVAVAWLGISRLVTGSWPDFMSSIRESLAEFTWNSPAVWAAAVVLALIGLILLLAAILPGKHTAVRLAGPSDADAKSVETVISRRGLSRLASWHLDHADGVESTSVDSTARKVTATVRTPLRTTSELSRTLTESLERKFDEIGVDPAPQVVVRVRSTE